MAYSAEFKKQAINDYIENHLSFTEFKEKYKLSHSTAYNWTRLARARHKQQVRQEAELESMAATGLELLSHAHADLLQAYETMMDTGERYEAEHSDMIRRIDKVCELILFLEGRDYRASHP